MTEPALTPDEWREGEFESRYGIAATSAQKDHKGRWFFHSEDANGTAIVILNQADDGGAASLKLAALALANEPFGFTREDVERIRTIVLDEAAGPWVANKFGFRTDDAYKWADSLASRIEALLPPETL